MIKIVKKWWQGSPEELSMQEVYDLKGEYKDKLVKSKSSLFMHSVVSYILKEYKWIAGIIIAISGLYITYLKI